MINEVINSKGEVESFDSSKLNRWVLWANQYGVDWTSIAQAAYRKCTDRCTTKELQKALISACVDYETESHLKVAGRLLAGDIYKRVFGGFKKIPTLSDFYKGMVSKGYWDTLDYSDAELAELNGIIDHKKDLEYGYTSLKQMVDKYLIKDLVEDVLHESPQFLFIGIAMANMESMPRKRRIHDVKKLYDYLSDMKINFPTPFLLNLRTNKKKYSSCAVYKSGDTAGSLATGDHIAYMMTAAGAGIGSYLQTRSEKDPVDGGRVSHLGKIPLYRMGETAVHALMQSSRGGSMTTYVNCLDPEIEDILRLKHPTTPPSKQVRGIDYALITNKVFARKAAKNEDWMLVSYQKAPDLYEKMFGDTVQFEEEYNKVLKSSVPKKMVKARDILIQALTQSVETGRLYLFFADEANTHTPFKDKIYSSNLCLEIALPTKDYARVDELYKPTESGEIGLCSLGAIVLGRVSESEYEDVAYYTALSIDNALDIMEYPFEQLDYTARKRRSIGVGLTNLAYDMASQGLSYTDEIGRNYIHRIAERHSYWLHKASLRLAIERGVCEWADRTKYPDGWLPIDTYNKKTDELHSQPLRFDWEELREDIVAVGGLRHSVLEAMMPVESSSLLSNTTNSVYPCRELKTIKVSGINTTIFIAPESETIGGFYENPKEVGNQNLIKMYSLFQKFVGQTISADLYIDPSEPKESSMSSILKDYFSSVKYGMKSRYYINTKMKSESESEDSCAGGSCKL